MPVTPHSDAGWRIEPPVSVAVATGAMRAATAAAEPPERAAGHQFRVPGILHRAVVAGLVRRAHGELVHVGLAERDHAGGAELLDHGGVIWRHEVVEHAASRSWCVTPCVQKMSLCASGRPVSGPALAGGQSGLGGLRLRQRATRAVTVMKALSVGCDASMRASRDFVSSVTENSLARSFFASSDSVSVCIS